MTNQYYNPYDPYGQYDDTGFDPYQEVNDNNNGNNSNNGNNGDGPDKKPNKKSKKRFGGAKKKAATWLLVGCFALGLGGGGIGAAVVNHVSGSGSNNTVVYRTAGHNDNTATTTSVSSSSKALSTEAISKNASPSVVSIATESKQTSSFYGDYVTQGAGSGVIISKDGYIVTCEHVVSDATSVKVTTSDNKEYTATVVGTDSKTDVALIKINASNLTPAVIGKSSELVTGEKAVAIGNPLGALSGTVTEGIISATQRNIEVENQKMTLIQTSAQVSPGNSGGGLFNKYGELIGIVESKSNSSSTNSEGLGFAVPIDTAMKSVENIKANAGKSTSSSKSSNSTDSNSSSNSSSDNSSDYGSQESQGDSLMDLFNSIF